MKQILFLFILVFSLRANDIEILDAYIAAAPPYARTTAAYMQIKNNSDREIALISAESNISDFTEIHTNFYDKGMIKMLKIPEIRIKSKSKISLKPGSFHIMLIGFIHKPTPNSKATLNLSFDNGKTIELENIMVKK